MASQALQKWVEYTITHRVSVIDVWDWAITASRFFKMSLRMQWFIDVSVKVILINSIN